MGSSGRGGTSRGGRNGVSGYPWGAHYIPAPTRENPAMVRLLKEFGLVEGQVVSTGLYPTRAQLAQKLGIPMDATDKPHARPGGCCCKPGECC